jgi:hypothetical protein
VFFYAKFPAIAKSNRYLPQAVRLQKVLLAPVAHSDSTNTKLKCYFCEKETTKSIFTQIKTTAQNDNKTAQNCTTKHHKTLQSTDTHSVNG